jgi:hypothetical protein
MFPISWDGIVSRLTCSEEDYGLEAGNLRHVQVQHLKLLHLFLEDPETK